MNWKKFLSMFLLFNYLSFGIVDPDGGGGNPDPDPNDPDPKDPDPNDPDPNDPDPDDPDDPDGKNKNDKVSRSAYEKVLQEKKNLAKWKKDQEDEAKKKKHDSLKNSEKWKELYQEKEKELAEIQEERDAYEKAIKDKTREGFVLKEYKKHNGNDKFYKSAVKKLIDFDKIMIDEDSGMAYGVEEQIKNIKKELPMLFTSGKDRHDHGGGGDNTPDKPISAGDAYKKKGKDDKRSKKERLLDAFKSVE